MTTTTKPALPEGVLASDLKYPKTDGWKCAHFDLWHLASGAWVIPTLQIAKSRRFADRTYAVGLDGKTWRVGNGPHIDRRVRVYVKGARAKALQRFLDLRQSGAVNANTIRDRISSRRAEGALHRALGHHSWRWGTL